MIHCSSLAFLPFSFLIQLIKPQRRFDIDVCMYVFIHMCAVLFCLPTLYNVPAYVQHMQIGRSSDEHPSIANVRTPTQQHNNTLCAKLYIYVLFHIDNYISARLLLLLLMSYCSKRRNKTQ